MNFPSLIKESHSVPKTSLLAKQPKIKFLAYSCFVSFSLSLARYLSALILPLFSIHSICPFLFILNDSVTFSSGSTRFPFNGINNLSSSLSGFSATKITERALEKISVAPSPRLVIGLSLLLFKCPIKMTAQLYFCARFLRGINASLTFVLSLISTPKYACIGSRTITSGLNSLITFSILDKSFIFNVFLSSLINPIFDKSAPLEFNLYNIVASGSSSAFCNIELPCLKFSLLNGILSPLDIADNNQVVKKLFPSPASPCIMLILPLII